MTSDTKHVYVQINGIWVPLHHLPCHKCEWRYSIHCPKCTWNADGRFDTYSGRVMSQKEADELNNKRKE